MTIAHHPIASTDAQAAELRQSARTLALSGLALSGLLASGLLASGLLLSRP